MIKKRFKVTNISENGNTGLFWLGKDNLSVYDVVRILNESAEENEVLKQQIEELEFKLTTIEAYDRTVKEEHSDTVYDFKKKLEKW